MKDRLIIATRKSPLALWQAETVKENLLKYYPDLHIELMGMLTQADKFLQTPLQNIGGKGLFVKELEQALIEGKADIAVHSIKDLPAELPPPLILAVIGEREDARDALVSALYQTLSDLPAAAKIGTSSLRRQSQLKALRPDLQFINLRGNVGSRLDKVSKGDFDAIVLAVAGLKRLGQTEKIKHYFSENELTPAIGQGAIGIECRKDDIDTQELIAVLDHLPSRYCITVERTMNEQFGGNCQIPIAAHAKINGQKIDAIGMVGNVDGSVILRSFGTGKLEEAEDLGRQLAQDLITQGAVEILNKK